MASTALEQQHGNEERPFRHYSLRHRITSWVSINLCDRMVYTQRHGLIKGMRRRGGLGWIPVSVEESAELRFWRDLDLAGQTVYDVGAFQGLLTLHFARHATRVIAYEPSSQTRERLLENLRLNNLSNVVVRPVGVGATSDECELYANPLMTGGASIEPATVKGLKASAQPLRVERIKITTLDQDIPENGLPAPDLIKIDIEGLEAEALRGARNVIAQHRPALFLEMHGETLSEKRRKAAEVVGLLVSYGYRRIRHVESGQTVGNENSEVALEGHLYAVREPAGQVP